MKIVYRKYFYRLLVLISAKKKSPRISLLWVIYMYIFILYYKIKYIFTYGVRVFEPRKWQMLYKALDVVDLMDRHPGQKSYSCVLIKIHENKIVVLCSIDQLGTNLCFIDPRKGNSSDAQLTTRMHIMAPLNNDNPCNVSLIVVNLIGVINI